jgi:hypothetical protein
MGARPAPTPAEDSRSDTAGRGVDNLHLMRIFLGALLLAAHACAPAYSQATRIVVPFPPGSGANAWHA